MIRRLAVGFLVLALAPSAGAANKDIERLQIQVSLLQTQIAEVKRTTDDSLRELKRLNESLAEQGALLRKAVADGRVQDEAVLASLKDLGERLADLGERLQGLQAPPAGLPAPGGEAGGPAPAPRELYSQAYADYARGNYDLAIQEYQEYLKHYADTDLADNAQFWIGECLYAKGRFEEAIEAWNGLLRDYPTSDKIPDARFKKGMALERLGRRSQALVEYRFVVDRFPNSDAGRKAREKLGSR